MAHRKPRRDEGPAFDRARYGGRMDAVTITVRGEERAEVPPERCEVAWSVVVEDASRAEAMTRAAATSARMRERLDALVASGALAEWSSDRVSASSHRPWSDGAEQPPVHRAEATFRAGFADLDEVGRFVDAIGALDDVELRGMRWSLTPETAEETQRRVAAAAVAVCVARAEAYAAAIGRGEVVITAVADQGLLGGGAPAGRAMLAAAPAGFEFRPEPVVVTAAVEASFVAR